MQKTLEQWLEHWLDSTEILPSGQVYKTKHFVDRVGDIEIHVWPGDHDPPHFHVYSKQRSIDATFYIDTLELRSDRTNQITQKDIKRIRKFFQIDGMYKKLLARYDAMQK